MAEPRNVLLITTDQMRADHLGCGGNPVIRTPHLDALAAGGVNLRRAYVNNPVCMPNRATIATGRLPRNHRCWDNGIDLPDCERTVADALNDRGYHTALLGKAHFRGHGRAFAGPQRGIESGLAWEAGLNPYDWTGPYYGFQHVQLAIGHGHANLSRAHQYLWVRRHHAEALRHQFDWEASPTGAMECFTPRYPAAAHSSNWLGEIGSEYIRRRAADGRRFLCWVSFPDPHHPFSPPKPYDTMYDPRQVVMPALGPEALADKPPHFRSRGMTEPQIREMIARTYGMVTLVDENVGRLLGALGETGLDETTVVVFTSDHGDLMGDCGLALKGPWLLEGLIRVPMIWRVPGGTAGSSSDGLFSSCDIAPTVLELLGVEVPAAMDGLAQGGLVGGGSGRRDAAVVEFRYAHPEQGNLRSIVTGDRKLTYYAGCDHGELYDMTAEVPEARNLYDDPAYAAERAALEKRLLDEMILTEDRRLMPTRGA